MKRILWGILGLITLPILVGLSIPAMLQPFMTEENGGDPVLYQHFVYIKIVSMEVISIELQPWMTWTLPLVTVIYAAILFWLVFGRAEKKLPPT